MRISLPRRPAIVAIVLTALAVGPATASAAVTATLNQRCYTHVPTKGSQPIVASLTGGTPNADFIFSATAPGKDIGSAGSVSGTFDADGNATASITDVFPPSASIDPIKGERVNLSVADYGGPASSTLPPETPVGSTLITNLAIDVATKPSNPRKQRRVRVSGTPFAGKTLFGFVTPKSGKKVLRRFKLGKGNACGFAASKKIVAPKGFAYGHYRLYVNAGPKLNRPLALAYAFRIFRTF